MKLLKLCLGSNNNDFQFLTHVYPSEIGVPIVLPLGSTIAEVFLKQFAWDIHQSNNPLIQHIV